MESSSAVGTNGGNARGGRHLDIAGQSKKRVAGGLELEASLFGLACSTSDKTEGTRVMFSMAMGMITVVAPNKTANTLYAASYAAKPRSL